LLFQRLYNWVKYKTLPPSFLFKNRLFIEKDSKHKRIFSNLGITFRNSKWSSYARYNIKNNFKINYFTLLLIFIFFIVIFILFYYYKYYFIKNFTLNFISFFFWVSLDSFDYYLSYLVWLFGSLFSLFLNSLYSWFFFNNFSNKNQTFFKKKTFNETFSKNTLESLNASKEDLNWVLYSWLSSNNVKSSTLPVESFFNNEFFQQNVKIWKTQYFFFYKLYKLTALLQSTNPFHNTTSVQNFFKINLNSDRTARLLFSYTQNFTNLDLNTLLLSYLEKKENNYFSTKLSNHTNNDRIRKTTSLFNFKNINNESTVNDSLVNSKIGIFFFTHSSQNSILNLNFFNTEFKNLNNYLLNQVKIGKIDRWLYKYSILHRKIIKTSHNLTLSKKIINLDFFSSNDFFKNIWNSENLNKLINNNKNGTNSLLSLFNLNGVTGKHRIDHINNFFSFKIDNENINFHENSYFWFLKRFYLYNSLGTNDYNLKKKKNSNRKTSTDSVDLDYVSFFLKNFSINYSFFNLKTQQPYATTFSNFSTTNKNLNNFLFDFYINTVDRNLMNKDGIEIIKALTCNNLLSSNKTGYFNYFNFNTKKWNNFDTINSIIAFKLNKPHLDYNHFYYFYSLIDYDKFFSEDLEYLFFFK